MSRARKLLILSAVAQLSYLEKADASPLDCLIEPSVEVEISSPVEGILAEVLVEPGQPVRRGSILARLASEVELSSLAVAEARANNTAQLTSAQSRYDFYSSRLERAQQLFDRSATTAEALERAETELIIAENELEAARQERDIASLEVERARAVLELKTIRSPLNGLVTRKFLDPGSLVGDRAVIMDLATLDPLMVRTFVPIAMWPLVQTAQEATVVPQAPFAVPARQATIDHIDPVFDVASGTFRVELTLPNADIALPAGLKCTVDFEEGQNSR